MDNTMTTAEAYLKVPLSHFAQVVELWVQIFGFVPQDKRAEVVQLSFINQAAFEAFFSPESHLMTFAATWGSLFSFPKHAADRGISLKAARSHYLVASTLSTHIFRTAVQLSLSPPPSSSPLDSNNQQLTHIVNSSPSLRPKVTTFVFQSPDASNCSIVDGSVNDTIIVRSRREGTACTTGRRAGGIKTTTQEMPLEEERRKSDLELFSLEVVCKAQEGATSSVTQNIPKRGRNRGFVAPPLSSNTKHLTVTLPENYIDLVSSRKSTQGEEEGSMTRRNSSSKVLSSSDDGRYLLVEEEVKEVSLDRKKRAHGCGAVITSSRQVVVDTKSQSVVTELPKPGGAEPTLLPDSSQDRRSDASSICTYWITGDSSSSSSSVLLVLCHRIHQRVSATISQRSSLTCFSTVLRGGDGGGSLSSSPPPGNHDYHPNKKEEVGGGGNGQEEASILWEVDCGLDVSQASLVIGPCCCDIPPPRSTNSDGDSVIWLIEDFQNSKSQCWRFLNQKTGALVASEVLFDKGQYGTAISTFLDGDSSALSPAAAVSSQQLLLNYIPPSTSLLQFPGMVLYVAGNGKVVTYNYLTGVMKSSNSLFQDTDIIEKTESVLSGREGGGMDPVIVWAKYCASAKALVILSTEVEHSTNMLKTYRLQLPTGKKDEQVELAHPRFVLQDTALIPESVPLRFSCSKPWWEEMNSVAAVRKGADLSFRPTLFAAGVAFFNDISILLVGIDLESLKICSHDAQGEEVAAGALPLPPMTTKRTVRRNHQLPSKSVGGYKYIKVNPVIGPRDTCIRDRRIVSVAGSSCSSGGGGGTKLLAVTKSVVYQTDPCSVMMVDLLGDEGIIKAVATAERKVTPIPPLEKGKKTAHHRTVRTPSVVKVTTRHSTSKNQKGNKNKQ